MSQKDKLIQRFLRNPKSVKYRDLVQVLIAFGFNEVPAKGSHVKYSHNKLLHDLIIPVHRNECKSFYKEEAKKCIEKISK